MLGILRLESMLHQKIFSGLLTNPTIIKKIQMRMDCRFYEREMFSCVAIGVRE